MKRSCGLRPPFSSQQIATWIVYPISTVSYFLLILGSINRGHKSSQYHHQYLVSALFVIHVVVVSVFSFFWYFLSVFDPEYKPTNRFCQTGVPVSCLKHSSTNTYYCPTCKKKVLGLDHHCLWLNTCIGARNYVPFLVLVNLGLLQFLLQIIFGIFIVVVVSHDEPLRERIKIVFGHHWIFALLASLSIALSALIALGFGVLISFHAYLLLSARMSTYEWILSKKEGERSSSVRSISMDEQAFFQVVKKHNDQHHNWKNINWQRPRDIAAVSKDSLDSSDRVLDSHPYRASISSECSAINSLGATELFSKTEVFSRTELLNTSTGGGEGTKRSQLTSSISGRSDFGSLDKANCNPDAGDERAIPREVIESSTDQSQTSDDNRAGGAVEVQYNVELTGCISIRNSLVFGIVAEGDEFLEVKLSAERDLDAGIDCAESSLKVESLEDDCRGDDEGIRKTYSSKLNP